MKSILKSIAVLLAIITLSSYTMSPDESEFNAEMGIGLSAPSVSVPCLGDQPEERQASHESRQLTRFEQGIVKKAIEKIEDMFKKANSQGRAAAYNLLGLPPEIQVEILNSLTPQERSDIEKMSKSHEELIVKFNKHRIEHLAKMQTELTYLNLFDLNTIKKLGKAFPNIKKLTIRSMEISLEQLFYNMSEKIDQLFSDAITVAFPQLEQIIIRDCIVSEFGSLGITFNKWQKDRPDRTVKCIWRRDIFRTLKHIT